jgi:hypothetical protein
MEGEKVWLRKYDHEHGKWTDQVFQFNPSLAGMPDLFPVKESVALECHKRFTEQQKADAQRLRSHIASEQAAENRKILEELAKSKPLPPEIVEEKAAVDPTPVPETPAVDPDDDDELPPRKGTPTVEDDLSHIGFRKMFAVVIKEGLTELSTRREDYHFKDTLRDLIRTARAKRQLAANATQDVPKQDVPAGVLSASDAPLNT